MSGRAPRSRVRSQRGAALLASILLFVVIGISAFLVVTRGGGTDDAERARITQQALTQAKAALIGYASAVPFTGPERPGDLPCPDLDNDGDADPPCSSAASRLGRLPWRTLGLPDLRDGAGERLWYAVSDTFKNNPRTPCNNPTDPGCLNSDATGSISVRNAENSLVHDGRARVLGTSTEFNYTAAIAVVIAPGAALTRQGGPEQTRPAANLNDPTQYLDTAFAEDNANFVDYSDADGFIGGPVLGPAGDVVVNDRLVVITHQELMPQLERRVAREVSGCLNQYATANNGRYPWAADTTDTSLGNYADKSGVRAGRVPDGMIAPVLPGNPPPPFPVVDQVFTRTADDSGGTMSPTWPGSPCNLGRGFNWWLNWKLHVFYAVADQFKPDAGTATLPCINCLNVISPGVFTAGVRYVVLVAGRRLGTGALLQPRTLAGDLANPYNFLEGENDFTALTADLFEIRPRADNFNDVTVYQ